MQARSRFRDALAIAFALLFPLAVAWVYFVVLAGRGQQTNPAFVVAYAGGKFLQAIFPALYAFAFERETLRPGRPSWRGIGAGVAFAGLASVLIFARYFGYLASNPRLHTAAERIHDKLRESGLDSAAGFLLAAAFFCVANSLFEEYYWRWFVFGRLTRYTPVAVAMTLAGLGFMAHHVVILGVYFPGRFWSLAVPMSLGVALGGVYWSWLYHRSGSLLGPWLSHGLIDAAVMVVGYDLLRAGWAA